MSQRKIAVAEEFAVMPIVREIKDGPYSGESFRVEHLVPALQQYDSVIVDLDGVLSLGSSFLEEAFGGLVRHHGYSAKDLKKRLTIKFELESYVAEAWLSIEQANKKKS